jgi:hypothetical protein
MKWESEDQIHAGLRRLTDEMRRLRQELRRREAAPPFRRTPSLPTEDERKLRPTRNDKAVHKDEER